MSTCTRQVCSFFFFLFFFDGCKVALLRFPSPGIYSGMNQKDLKIGGLQYKDLKVYHLMVMNGIDQHFGKFVYRQNPERHKRKLNHFNYQCLLIWDPGASEQSEGGLESTGLPPSKLIKYSIHVADVHTQPVQESILGVVGLCIWWDLRERDQYCSPISIHYREFKGIYLLFVPWSTSLLKCWTFPLNHIRCIICRCTLFFCFVLFFYDFNTY